MAVKSPRRDRFQILCESATKERLMRSEANDFLLSLMATIVAFIVLIGAPWTPLLPNYVLGIFTVITLVITLLGGC